MAYPYDPNADDEDLADQREQAAYDQEEVAARQELMQPVAGADQTFDINGQPVTQALPTAPMAPPPAQQLSQPQQLQQQFETFDYNASGQTQQPAPVAATVAQPQRPQQRPLAPYPGGGLAQRPNRRDQASTDRQARFGTIISDETFDVSPEVTPQPTGGLGSVVALEFENFGHDILSAVNAFAKNQLNMPLPQLEAVNAQLKEHIGKVREGLDPERRAAQGISVLDDPAAVLSMLKSNPGAVAEVYAVSLATGILGGLGPGLAAKFAVRTGARVVAGSAAAAGRAADVTAIGTMGATGALQQTGARYEDYVASIDKMTDEDKSKSSMYQGFRAQNMDDAAAKEAMKSQFPMLAQLGVNFVTSTGIAAVTPGMGGVLPRLSTRARNIAAGAAEAGGSAGAGTAGSAAIQEQSKVDAGLQPAINWGRVAAEGGVAAGLGGVFGGTFGAFHGTRPAEPARPPEPSALPPSMLALPPPRGDLPGPGGSGDFTMRRDTVTPSGVPPEHTAALNAAGIGRQAIETEPGAQQFRPPGPDTVPIGRDESFFAPPPPRYDLPAGTVLPPADPAGWQPPRPPPPLAPDTGPRLLTASPERGPGFEVQQPGAPVRTYEEPVGPPATSATVAEPAAAPAQLTATPERGPGFTTESKGPAGTTEPPLGGRIDVLEAQPTVPVTAPRPSEGLSPKQLIKALTAEGLPQAQINRLVLRGREKLAAALDQRVQEREARGEAAPTPSRADAAKERLAGQQAQRETALRERTRAARGEEPEPAPRGAEAREPAPTARPSEGMSHKKLGEALQEKGLSKREVNNLLTKEAHAAAYDKIVRDEEAALSRIGEKEQGENVGTEAKAQAKREAAAAARADEVAATPEDTPPTITHELPATQASRDQRNQPLASESPLARSMADDRVNAPVRAVVEASGTTGSRLHDSLRAIADNAYTRKRMPHVAAYARLLMRLVPDMPVMHDSRNIRQGAFVPRDSAKGRADFIEISNPTADTILHEATHAAAQRFINNLQPGSREFRVLEAIRDELRRGAEGIDDSIIRYALSNPHELHAMVRTNPELHATMRNIVPSGEYRATMAKLGYPVETSKSLWQSLVRFTRRMLGMPQNVTSLMDHVMRPLDDISRAGARYNRDPSSAYTYDSPVYHTWDRGRISDLPPLPDFGRVINELPSFSDVRRAVATAVPDPKGRAGNILVTAGRMLKQGMPREQLMGFTRHLFNPSTGGNLLDRLKEVGNAVERAGRDYAVARPGGAGTPTNFDITRDIAKRVADRKVAQALINSSRVDTNPAYPLDHWRNDGAQAALYPGLKAEYDKLTSAQKNTFNETFDMYHRQRLTGDDAALRGIAENYLDGVTPRQVDTLVREMQSKAGVNRILNDMDNNPVAKAFGDAWVGNREFVNDLAGAWRRGWINNYVPMHRPGDWIVSWNDAKTGEPGQLSRATQREALAARDELIAAGEEPTLVVSREQMKREHIPRLTIIDKFENKLQAKLLKIPEGQFMTPEQIARERAAGKLFDSPEQIDAARAMLTKVLLDKGGYGSPATRQRMGLLGADPAALPQAVSSNFMSFKSQLGHLRHGLEYESTLGAMDRHVREMWRGAGTVKVNGSVPTHADVQSAQFTLDEFKARRPVSEDPHNLVMQGAQNATMLTYFQTLASPAQTMMNGLETYMQGIPRIGATFGLGRATTALARASADIMPRQFMAGLRGTKAVLQRSLDAGEWNSADQILAQLKKTGRDEAGMTQLMKGLTDEGLIGYSDYRDLQRMARPGMATSRAGKTFDMATDLVGILHSKMEDANRAVLAVAAYDVYTQKHGTAAANKTAAVEFAKEILYKSAPNYNYPNKPRVSTAQGMFGAWGIPITQFRQHGMWSYSQMALDIRNAFKGADAATKSEARYALAFTIGMQTVLLGTLNWMADPLRYLWGAYDALSGGKPQNHEHDFRIAANNIFGRTVGDLVSRGVLGAGGYGPAWNTRIGMINPLQIAPLQGDFTEPKTYLTFASEMIAGAPAVSAGSSIIAGFENAIAGNWGQAAIDILPKVLRDPVKAVRGEVEGQYSRRGRLIQTPEQISAMDTFWQVLGSKSHAQQEKFEQYGAEKQFVDRATASRTAATRDAAAVLTAGTAAQRQAAKRVIDEHNARYPGDKIDPKDVFSYHKRELERMRDPRLAGLTVSKAMRPYVRQQGAFANY